MVVKYRPSRKQIRSPDAPFWTMLRAAVRKILVGALEQTGQRVRPAALLLGIDHQTFMKYARDVGLSPPTYRNKGLIKKKPKENAHDQAHRGVPDDGGTVDAVEE